MSELSEDDYSHYSEYSSQRTERSQLEELLERFTVEAQPECTLKLRHQAGPVIFGGDLTHITSVRANVAALVLKPSNPDQVWRRLRVDNSGTFTLRSRKLKFWVLTLDATAHANPFTGALDVNYRLATKWDLSRGEYRNKKKVELSPNAEARAHWSIVYNLPAIEGSMGTAAQRLSQEMHPDVGYAHLSIPRLELVMWPRGRPGTAAEPPSSTAVLYGGSSGGIEGGAASSSSGGGAAAGSSCCGAGAAEGPQLGSGSSTAALPVVPLGSSAADDYLSVGGTGRAAATPPGSSSTADRRPSSLQQLNSHVACLSGRWWETFGQQH